MSRFAFLLVGVAVAVALVAAGPISAEGRTTPRCAPAAVQAWLSTQGTAAQSVTFLMLRNRRPTPCLFSTVVRFEVERDGQPAEVKGNPLRVRLHGFLRASRTAYAEPDVWWANWCGSGSGLEMTARFGTRAIRSRFRTLPVCLRRDRPSTLSIPRS